MLESSVSSDQEACLYFPPRSLQPFWVPQQHHASKIRLQAAGSCPRSRGYPAPHCPGARSGLPFPSLILLPAR